MLIVSVVWVLTGAIPHCHDIHTNSDVAKSINSNIHVHGHSHNYESAANTDELRDKVNLNKDTHPHQSQPHVHQPKSVLNTIKLHSTQWFVALLQQINRDNYIPVFYNKPAITEVFEHYIGNYLFITPLRGPPSL